MIDPTTNYAAAILEAGLHVSAAKRSLENVARLRHTLKSDVRGKVIHQEIQEAWSILNQVMSRLKDEGFPYAEPDSCGP